MFEWLKKVFGSKPSCPESRNYTVANVVGSEPSQESPRTVQEASSRDENVAVESAADERNGSLESIDVNLHHRAEGLESPPQARGRHRLDVEGKEASVDADTTTNPDVSDSADSQDNEPDRSTVLNLDEQIESEKSSVPSEGEDKESQLIDELTKEAEIYVEKE